MSSSSGGRNSGLDSASSSSSSTSTSSPSESDSEEEEPDGEVVHAERKRKVGNVGAVSLNEQSVLKDGYLLPVLDGQGGQSDSEHEPEEVQKVETETFKKEEEAPLAVSTAAAQRRLGVSLQEKDIDKQQQQRNDDHQKAGPKNAALAFKLAWEQDEEFPIFAVQVSLDPAQLEKAILHYRSLPQAESQQYHCLVNLACCLMALNRPRPAKSLLEQAAELQPSRASAQLNLVCCYLRILHRSAALQAIDQALRNAEDLTAEDHRLLISTKKELASTLSKPTDKSPGQPGRKADSSVRRRIVARYQVFTRLEAWQMRKDLLALRSTEAIEDIKPPWRRPHSYSEDSEQAINSKKARWQPLTPDALQSLRLACRKVETYGEANNLDMESDDSYVREDTDESESDEDDQTNLKLLRNKAARQAYDCIKNLSCMQALAEDKAIALLQAAEIVDFEADSQIFEEGDPALDVYIIVRGSVSIKVLMPELAANPIPVQSLYDGQVFGDAKVAAWKDVQAPPPKRQAGATTQEDTCLLRIPAPAYRQALGLDGKHSRSNGEGEEEETALLPDVRRKVQALSRSPLFEGAAASNLVLLATNVQEVALRHDDVFVEIDQALQACFLISEGYVRVSVPAVDMEAKLGSLEDASRVLGMGRLPDAKMKIRSAAPSGTSHLPSHPHSRCNQNGNPKSPGSQRRPSSKKAEQSQKAQGISRFIAKAKAGETPVFQLGERPLLLPPSTSATSPVSKESVPRASRFTARKPGTPRRGTPWEKRLRQSRVAPFLGSGSGDIEMCLLHAGEAFGLASLFDAKGECSYLSSCEVRVQSSVAKILVLTPGSLLYLNETLARSLVDKAKNSEDPVAPSLKSIKRERLNRSQWIVRKQQVLHQVVMQED